jgi:hypothetical protein
MIQTIDLICGCGRHKEVNVDTYPRTDAAPSPRERIPAQFDPGDTATRLDGFDR